MQNKPTLDQRSFVVGLGKTVGGGSHLFKIEESDFLVFQIVVV